jgi:hypothetical protein
MDLVIMKDGTVSVEVGRLHDPPPPRVLLGGRFDPVKLGLDVVLDLLPDVRSRLALWVPGEVGLPD